MPEKILYCIFNKNPWFLLGYCVAENSPERSYYHHAREQAMNRYPTSAIEVAPAFNDMQTEEYLQKYAAR